MGQTTVHVDAVAAAALGYTLGRRLHGRLLGVAIALAFALLVHAVSVRVFERLLDADDAALPG